MTRREFIAASAGSAAGILTRTADGISATMAPEPVVKTRAGFVRGEVADRVYVFRGVPFAAPPVGTGRFAPPVPREPWMGTRDALAFGPKSPQTPYPPFVELLLPELTPSGDDCLTLNVWSPSLGATRLPVMVWVSGGLFEYHGTGASPWYDGSSFARDGVVCVTFNYRVGAAGFLYLADGTANVGLLDQVAALEWVRDNIAAFGGDPGNVTVFGESAGALSIATLLSMPRAKGLFRRAVIQSGGAQHVSSPAAGRRIGQLLAQKMGVEPRRDAIAAASVDRLLQAQIALRTELEARPDPAFWEAALLTGLPWQPVIDGDVVPDLPLARLRAGASAEVDVMVGSNTDENRLFLVTAGAIDQIPPPAVAAALAGDGLQPEPALAAYRSWYPGASAGELLAAIQTDWYWRIPGLNIANAHASNARGGATYMYEFAWRGSPQFAGRLGAGHSMEIPFVFDTLGRRTEPLHGANPPQALATRMHRAWVAFATSGDPGWPRYDTTRRATMHFDVASAVVDDPLARESLLWSGAR